jgi:hypothetical protein
VGKGEVVVYRKVRGKIVSIGVIFSCWWFDCIACPIIVCDGDDCSGVVIGVSG